MEKNNLGVPWSVFSLRRIDWVQLGLFVHSRELIGYNLVRVYFDGNGLGTTWSVCWLSRINLVQLGLYVR